MRGESSTVVVLAGGVTDDLLAELGQSPNVAVTRVTAADARARGTADQGTSGDAAQPRPGWEPGALALREAMRRLAMYVVVPDDPLAAVAAGWRAMWDVPGGSPGPAQFEQAAAEALAAWRSKQFELPDYYLVIADSQDTGPDLYLGPLHAARPRRVAIAATAGESRQAARVLDSLGSLEHGPWWPPLDEIVDSARGFFPGSLAESGG
ncbi:MAG TPA: hypothetical protein VGI64_01635 [Streptosporangiaceae bacterium]|jgi:hypothetical protein